MNASLPYRPCVGIMVLNAHGKVWVGHRLGTPEGAKTMGQKLWQMPQGGVDAGEDLEAAALRELYEETGMKSVSLLGQTKEWLHYDFPPDASDRLKGKWQGQKQKWFAFRFEGEEAEIQINPPPDGHDAEFDDWYWEDIAVLPELIVPFKRHVYEQVVVEFQPLASSVR